jgi:hypothetical protein
MLSHYEGWNTFDTPMIIHLLLPPILFYYTGFIIYSLASLIRLYMSSFISPILPE